MEGFNFPTNPEEADAALDHFITRHLPEFGDWQDFMKSGEPWMWHAHISAGMNLGLIDPLDACRRAEAEYRAGRAPLNAVEGFVRQILGWREICARRLLAEGTGLPDHQRARRRPPPALVLLVS